MPHLGVSRRGDLLSQVGARTYGFQLPQLVEDPCLPWDVEAPYVKVLVQPLKCREHAQGKALLECTLAP